jgi:hypothetical protein
VDSCGATDAVNASVPTWEMAGIETLRAKKVNDEIKMVFIFI